jgi:hypothetical protein
MKPNREEEAKTKTEQIANALVEYLVRHDVHSGATAMSFPEWARAAAKMQNENLLVHMYETIALRLRTESLGCAKSAYLREVDRQGVIHTYYDFPRSQKEMDERLDKEASA